MQGGYKNKDNKNVDTKHLAVVDIVVLPWQLICDLEIINNEHMISYDNLGIKTIVHIVIKHD